MRVNNYLDARGGCDDVDRKSHARGQPDEHTQAERLHNEKQWCSTAADTIARFGCRRRRQDRPFGGLTFA